MSAISQHRANLCHFTFANGRCCRMLLSPSHTYLCTFHTRKESQALASEKVGRYLAATLSHNYITACDLTAALSQLFGAIAQGHLKPKTANTLAYVGQTHRPNPSPLPAGIHQPTARKHGEPQSATP